MDSILANYIQQHKNVDREVHYTHVNCVRPKGRYAFDRQELEGFWKIYCDRFSKNNEMVSGMAEIPQDYSMLVVDGDIKKKISDLIKHHPEINTEIKDGDNTKIKYRPIRLYNKEHIRNVVKAYQSVIKTVTKDWNPSHSLCILLEKNPYLSDEYVKSGFHLAFVNYFGNKTLQNMHLIPRVVDIVNDLEIFKDIGYSVSSEVLDISKKSNDSKPWLLYGSRKSETSDIYRASSAFLDEGIEISLESAFENYKLYDVFENEIEYKSYDDLVKLFPRVFSINPCFRQTVEIVQGFNHLDNITYNSYSPTNDSDDTKYDQSYEQRMATASKLVELLSASRAENFNEWMEIGWILHSISDGSEAGFHLWDTFSQQSEKYSWEICMDKWGKMYKGNHTIGSLIHYARIDSPEEYEEFRLQRIEKFIKKAINGSHHDLAKALYESYSTEYVCASLKPEMWFEYKNHHWEPMEEGIELRRKISDELVKRYNSIIKKQFDEAVEIDDEDDETKKNSDDRIKALHKLIMNLKCNTFKNSVMKECREVFYDGKFLKRLGKDKYLIALQNGVYDLQNHVFRNGKPEDYIAFQMPIAYREFNEMDPWVIETHNFFEKIFPDTSIRQYFMERLAEMLVGGNKRKHVYFWTGRGNNGKSVAKAFVQKMFGSYFIDIPNSILVGQKPKNGQACPELARADRGVRAAFTQEPNKKDLINTGALKEYSGNDTFYTRTLFEKGGEIEPMFKLVMITNDLPGVTTNDPAVWNRIRVIPFESTFTDNPPEDEDEQFRTKTFKKDENFDEKLEKMLEPLFWILVKLLPKIKRVIYEPPKVKEATDKYRRSQDIYAQFIDERTIEDDTKRITISDFFEAFRNWHKQSFPNVAVPTRNDCNDYLTDEWGYPVNYGWKGRRLRTERDDILDGRADECESVDYNNMQNPLV